MAWRSHGNQVKSGQTAAPVLGEDWCLARLNNAGGKVVRFAKTWIEMQGRRDATRLPVIYRRGLGVTIATPAWRSSIQLSIKKVCCPCAARLMQHPDLS